MKSCATPADSGRASPSASRNPSTTGASRASGRSRTRRRSNGSLNRGHRPQPRLGSLAALLAAAGDLVEPGDLALALDPDRVALRQPLDPVPDAVAQLKREVRGGGAHQLAQVLHRGLA